MVVGGTKFHAPVVYLTCVFESILVARARRQLVTEQLVVGVAVVIGGGDVQFVVEQAQVHTQFKGLCHFRFQVTGRRKGPTLGRSVRQGHGFARKIGRRRVTHLCITTAYLPQREDVFGQRQHFCEQHRCTYRGIKHVVAAGSEQSREEVDAARCIGKEEVAVAHFNLGVERLRLRVQVGMCRRALGGRHVGGVEEVGHACQVTFKGFACIAFVKVTPTDVGQKAYLVVGKLLVDVNQEVEIGRRVLVVLRHPVTCGLREKSVGRCVELAFKVGISVIHARPTQYVEPRGDVPTRRETGDETLAIGFKLVSVYNPEGVLHPQAQVSIGPVLRFKVAHGVVHFVHGIAIDVVAGWE